MSAPSLCVQINGGPGVSGDQLNTYEQTCDTAAQLRAFIGVQGIQVYMRGQSAVADGYQGVFYWNYGALSPVDDNGATTIVPNGAGVGCWSRIVDPNNAYLYSVPLDGFNLTLGHNTSSLILNPAGVLSSGSITMPSSPFNGQFVRISSTKNITTISVSANVGQTINNAPTSLTAGVGVAFQFVLSQLSWFKVA